MSAYLITFAKSQADLVIEDADLNVVFLDSGWVAFYEGHPEKGGHLALALPRDEVASIQRVDPEPDQAAG